MTVRGPVFGYGFAEGFCPKTDVVVTSSSDDGKTLVSIAKVTRAKASSSLGPSSLMNHGHGHIVLLDENDFFNRGQFFLAQVASGRPL